MVGIRSIRGPIPRGGARLNVVAELLRYAGQTFDVHRLSLLLAEEPGGPLVPFASDFPSGVTDRAMFEEWRGLDLEPTGLVTRVRAGEDELRADPPDAPGGLPPAMVDRFEMLPFVALAIRRGDELDAVLVVEGSPAQLDANRDAAVVLRDHLASALTNARAEAREAARAAEAEALLEVSRVLARTTELAPVLVAVARQSARVAGFERCSIFLLDEDEQRLVPTMSQFADGHRDEVAWDRFVTNEADLPVGWEVMRTRAPVAVERAAEHPDLVPPEWHEPFGIATCVYLPLVAWDECFGVLVLDHRHPTAIDRQQLDMAEGVANQGAVAIGVGRLLARLKRTNEELERADRAKDEFLSMLSHELRNPVTAVLGFTATLERSWDQLAPERRGELLARIRANAERQDRMIDDLLQTSRIVNGDLQVRSRTVPLGPLVEDALSQLHLPPDTVEADVTAVLVHADPDHIRQIVSNLVTNAHKYGRAPIEVVTRRPGRETVELCVHDHGDGVPPEFVPQLFERFTQAQRDRSDAVGGVGLGLSIARRLARASGGDLRYRNGSSGATFVLELPAAATRSPGDVVDGG